MTDVDAQSIAAEREYIRSIGIQRELSYRLRIEDALLHPHPTVRRIAARALGWLRCHEVAPALMRALEDIDTDTRRWAAASLALTGCQSAGHTLRHCALHDAADTVRAACIRTLGWLSITDAIRDVQVVFSGDPSAAVRSACIESLSRLDGFEDGNILIRALKDPAGDVRTQAARALQTADLPHLSILLAQCIADTDPHVRIAGLRTVVSRQLDVAEDWCAHALSDPNPGVRIAALMGLHLMQIPHPDPYYQKVADDPHPEVQYHLSRIRHASRAIPK